MSFEQEQEQGAAQEREPEWKRDAGPVESGGRNARDGLGWRRGSFRNDVLLIVGIAAVALALTLFFRWRGSGMGQAVITVDGAVFQTVSLAQNQRVEIVRGDYYNVVVIEDGVVYMEEANCPDYLCVRRGRISNGVQSIVCLPNRVTVKLAGQRANNGEPDVDAVSE